MKPFLGIQFNNNLMHNYMNNNELLLKEQVNTGWMNFGKAILKC